MCSNYQPVTSLERLLTFFGAERNPDLDPSPAEIYPLGLAPFIRKADEASGNRRIVENALFGMIPPFAKEIAYGRKTYNARSETVDQLVTYKAAWAKGQRCIIPAEAIFEPCYETGKAVRWCIQQDGGVPMGIAGIYRPWRAPDGRWLWTMSMLTVNADGHPIFKRMHRSEEEKRMVVILDRADYLGWLSCDVSEAPRYLRQWPGALLGEPSAVVPVPKAARPAPEAPEAALPPPPKPAKARPPKPPAEGDPPVQGDLF